MTNENKSELSSKALKKKYYPLDEAASILDCKPDDLIHLGAQDELPIYALADGWHAHVWAREIEDSASKYGDTEQTLGKPILKSPLNAPTILNGLVRLQVGTLVRYEANTDTITNSFALPEGGVSAPDYISEYRLCNPSDPTKPIDIALKSCKLVVLDHDLQSIAPSHASPEKLLGETEKRSLLKMVIGMAVIGYGFNPLKLKSDTTTEISDDLESAGVPLDQDTIRKWLKEAAKLLPAKEHLKN